MGVYSWQVITGDGSCYNRTSKPGMSLQSWVSDGIAKRAIFQAEGLPTVAFDVSRDTLVIFNHHNDPDPRYRDYWTPGEEGEARKQPRIKYQVIGYERDGLMVAMLIDLDNGSVDLIDRRIG